VRGLRHILILVLDIVKFAEREGEEVEAEVLGEGSYAKVYGAGSLAAKVISDRERPWVHKASVQNALEADRMGLGPQIYGHGSVEQTLGGRFRATVILMERLEPLGATWSALDTQVLLNNVQQLSQHQFHNDLKLDNVLRRETQPLLIDFDLMDPWKIKIAVTANCIEHSFQDFLKPLGAVSCHFREYYDLFTMSLTLQDGELYRAVLRRLVELWSFVEVPVLRPLLESMGPEKLLQVPFEVLIRVPLQGVTVNLLDLRGNLFAHLPDQHEIEDEGKYIDQIESMPQLLKSNGVYWP